MNAPDLAARVAARLGAIEGVVAVGLGGSWARGTADGGSDVDLGIYYRPAALPARAALATLARELDDGHPPDAVTDFGAWGPWVNGGAWLTIEGQRVDWLYRDLDRVAATIADCQAGRPACHYQVGHPHAFLGPIYLGEIHHVRPLHDPEGVLMALKARTAEYPAPLARALVETFLFEADFALMTAGKAADRGDVFYVAGCLFRAAACLVQVLFAANRRYCLNEKGALREVGTFARRPPDFVETTSRVLGAPGTTPAELHAGIAALAAMVRATRALAVEP